MDLPAAEFKRQADDQGLDLVSENYTDYSVDTQREEDLQENENGLQYIPLSLFDPNPEGRNDSDTIDYDLKFHKSDYLKKTKLEELLDLNLSHQSYLYKMKDETTKLTICITIYNEPFYQVIESLIGLYRTYYELLLIDSSYEDKVSVYIIADGFDKLNDAFLKAAYDAGLYDEEMCADCFTKSDLDDHRRIIPQKDKTFKELKFYNNETSHYYGTHNIAHCFTNYFTFSELLIGLEEKQRDRMRIEGKTLDQFLYYSHVIGNSHHKMFKPKRMPISLVIKHSNKQKIESHMWFFKGFTQYLNPEYTQIIDAGTIALPKSISHIIMHMTKNKNVGGSCGEIEVMVPEKTENGDDFGWIEKRVMEAQYVEYKLSHYLDKAYESLFGFISVLPGAFSTFRWEAIRGEPLDKFLKGLSTDQAEMKIPSCSQANMYLAVDRIFCLEILVRSGKEWILNYVPDCKALTDPPFSIINLIK